MSEPLDDTTDLRRGPPIHDGLLALLPLVGTWAGVGRRVDPSTGEQFRYVERLSFAHDGRPFLVYESRTWRVDDQRRDAQQVVGAPLHRELGFWRPGAGADDVEATLATECGLSLSYIGTSGDLYWQLESTQVTATPTATAVAQDRRSYGISDDRLVYVYETALEATAMAPSANGELIRVISTGS